MLVRAVRNRAPKFDAEFFEMPDGTITAIIRTPWPAADDVVEVLGHSVRSGPLRVSAASLDEARSNAG